MTASSALSPAAVRPAVSSWRRRLVLTGYAGVQVLWCAPLLVLLVVLIAGGVLSVVWVGLPVLLLGLPLLRAAADAQRRMAADVLGQPVPRPYSPAPAGGPLLRLRSVLLDPMTWRDLAWLLWTLTAGFALSLVVVLLLGLVVTLGIWWYGVGPLMTMRFRVDRVLLSRGHTEVLEDRVEVLTRSRERAVDASAAELRRIERDLHDGAQARLVALAMNLGMAEQLLEKDPGAARRLVAEAGATSRAALGDLRSVVRGIHPPVLADRGLVDAVRALALDMAGSVVVEGHLPGRPPPPVESAVFFAVAECLANVGKHAGARSAWVRLRYADGRLHTEVGDDGRGGADLGRGTGLRGMTRRLDAFDGTMSVSSPPGGPTIVTLEVPCRLSAPTTPSDPSGSSSPRTPPSSAPG